MVLVGFILGFLLLAAIFAGVRLLYWLRASAMRALALRWGFRYTKGDPRFWFLPKKHCPLPTSFRLRGYPVNTINRTWNVVEGEMGGISILILDSTLGFGAKRGRYSTFIAAQTDRNPFGVTRAQEKIAHSNGWTAVYRLRFWQIPWTLSIQRIEEHLNSLGK